MSLEVWNMYINQADKSLVDKVGVSISSSPSPVIGMEQAILNLKPKQIANNVINLYAGAEDQSRYQYFVSDRFKLKISEQHNISPEKIQIKANLLDRLGSATDVRSQILRVATQEADIQTLEKMLPPGVNIPEFLNLVKKFK